MNKLIAAIEALPDGKKLVYAVSTNEVVHGYNYACTTDDLKALANQLKWIPVSEPPSETGSTLWRGKRTLSRKLSGKCHGMNNILDGI